MSKMIPLKIADMAVESCNKEIARLLFEKAELQGRVIALEAELESEKAAMKALMTTPCSRLLRAERDEVARLKAEVERLEKEVWRMKMLNDIDGDTIKGLKVALKTDPEWAKVLEAIENNARLEAENRELKAENERLRKAGDEVIHEWSSGDETESRNFMKALVIWNAAKEGKPSV